MSQSEKSFTVSDRRHFTAEGRPREEEQPDSDVRERPPGSEDQTQPPGGEAKAPAPPGLKSPDPAEDRPAELSHFLLGLAAEAGRLLSGEGVPEGTPREQALAGARSIVAILEMLKDKTEGRRTTEEDTLLAALLFELRMAYVAQTGKP